MNSRHLDTKKKFSILETFTVLSLIAIVGVSPALGQIDEREAWPPDETNFLEPIDLVVVKDFGAVVAASYKQGFDIHTVVKDTESDQELLAVTFLIAERLVAVRSPDREVLRPMDSMEREILSNSDPKEANRIAYQRLLSDNRVGLDDPALGYTPSSLDRGITPAASLLGCHGNEEQAFFEQLCVRGTAAGADTPENRARLQDLQNEFRDRCKDEAIRQGFAFYVHRGSKAPFVAWSKKELVWYLCTINRCCIDDDLCFSGQCASLCECRGFDDGQCSGGQCQCTRDRDPGGGPGDGDPSPPGGGCILHSDCSIEETCCEGICTRRCVEME